MAAFALWSFNASSLKQSLVKRLNLGFVGFFDWENPIPLRLSDLLNVGEYPIWNLLNHGTSAPLASLSVKRHDVTNNVRKSQLKNCADSFGGGELDREASPQEIAVWNAAGFTTKCFESRL